MDALTRSGAAQYDLMLARAVYVQHETEGHRDGSVAFPSYSRRVARAAGVAWVIVTAILVERSYWMAKSRYDRNVDRGAVQQRNYGQGAKREDNKPETTAEEPTAPHRHGQAPKNTGGPARGGQQPPWRP